MRLERILFPVDLSDHCRSVAPFVRAVALRFQSQVLMLHVMELPPYIYGPSPDVALAAVANIDEWRKERRALLEKFLCEEFAGVSVVREMVEGDAATEIVTRATANQIDLIMMPTHGYGRFRALLLGSVTAKVLHDADCPVWTAVHSEEVMAHPAPDRWRRILCAVDLTTEDAHTVSWARELAGEEAAEFLLVHAIPASDVEAMPDEPIRELEMHETYTKMAALFGDAVTERQVLILFGPPARVVPKIAAEWEADLVAIGRGKLRKPLGQLRSHLYGIIRESPCPVISVSEGEGH